MMPKSIDMLKFKFFFSPLHCFPYHCLQYQILFNTFLSWYENEIFDLNSNNPEEIAYVFIIPEITCPDKNFKVFDCYVNDVVLSASVKLPFWNNKNYNWKYVILDANTRDTI